MFDLLKKFASNEDGAVTVDWVVLCAAVVGLGATVALTITTSATDLSDAIWAYMETIRP